MSLAANRLSLSCLAWLLCGGVGAAAGFAPPQVAYRSPPAHHYLYGPPIQAPGYGAIYPYPNPLYYPAPARFANLPSPSPALSRRLPAGRPAAEATQPVPATIASEEPRTTAQPVDKSAFLAMLRPIIEQENQRVLASRAMLQELLHGLDPRAAAQPRSAERLAELARRYRVASDPTTAAARQELLLRVDAIPVSMALAQAANESAWGRSRFAREAFNLFGIWTYDPAKGIVPKQRQPGKRHLIRRYESFQASVRHYLHTLNSHPAYAQLREIRAQQREAGARLDGLKLARGLQPYSALGEQYVDSIRQLILAYDLDRLDRPSLDG